MHRRPLSTTLFPYTTLFRSTTEMLKPLAQATGGDARRVVDGSSIDLPRIVPVRASSVFRGEGWMGVKMRDASVVKGVGDRKSTRLNSSHQIISYAVFCLKKK